MASSQTPTRNTASASIPTVEIDDKSTGAEGSQEKEKSGIKKFWPFKKKDEKVKDTTSPSGGLTSDYSSQLPRSTSPAPVTGMSTPTSPVRGVGASPRVASPASSQIFERNVQEESLAPAAVPSAIPNHIATENHIPPALDASSMAITDAKLDPDKVEIFTHVAHTPAAVTVAQGTAAGSVTPSGVLSEASTSPTLPPTSEEAAASRIPYLAQGGSSAGAASPSSLDDGTSSYGALDSTDVRRLSFISFADVVHGEQSQNVGSDASSTAAIPPSSSGLAPGIGPTSAPGLPLSPPLSSTSPIISSPLRSASPARAPSPARAVSPSAAARAASPSLSISNAGSPKIVGANPSPPAGVVGELAVETMSQALRKTGSGDMNAARERDRDAASGSTGVEGLGLGTHQ